MAHLNVLLSKKTSRFCQANLKCKIIEKITIILILVRLREFFDKDWFCSELEYTFISIEIYDKKILGFV